MSHDVFISYSTQDREVANAVCHRMEETGIRCWIAPRDVRTGDAWDQAIVDAIAGAKIVVLIFSKAANNSRAVGNEIVSAAEANKIIFPFRIEDVTPSGGLQLHLRRLHWLDAMSPPLEAHIGYLVENAARVLKGGPEPAGPSLSQPPSAVRKPYPSWLPVGAIVGSIVAIAAVAALFITGRSPITIAPIGERPSVTQPAPAIGSPSLAEPPPVAPPSAAQPPADVQTPPPIVQSPSAMQSPPARPPAQPGAAAAGGFVFPDSERRLLTLGDLAGLSCSQMEIARNEIYARLGRYFQRSDLTGYFSQFPWYRPNTWNPNLNSSERENVAVIAEAEGRMGCHR